MSSSPGYRRSRPIASVRWRRLSGNSSGCMVLHAQRQRQRLELLMPTAASTPTATCRAPARAAALASAKRTPSRCCARIIRKSLHCSTNGFAPRRRGCPCWSIVRGAHMTTTEDPLAGPCDDTRRPMGGVGGAAPAACSRVALGAGSLPVRRLSQVIRRVAAS